jgi:hypothetical protein
LFNKYWSPEQEVVVMGYHVPTAALPNNFRFHSIARQNAPQSKWSNSLITFLNEMPDEHFVLMLEDYWISRPVDMRCIDNLYTYMQSNPNVLRFDLTGDVAHCHGDCRDSFKFGFINNYDIVEKPPGLSYRMSFQSGIWNKQLLLSLLVNDKNPWEVEIQTSVPDNMLVLGTLQCPLRYANAIYKSELDIDEIKKLNPLDYQIVERTFPKEISRRKK